MNWAVPLLFEAIGTAWQIDLPLLEPTLRADLEKKIGARIEEFDKQYSRFRKDSLIAEMANNSGTYELPADAEPLFSLYERLYDLTGGAVTPLIGQVLADAGYDAEYSLRPKSLRCPPAWNEILDYRFPRLRLKQPVLLDFGAAGKGYLIDLVADILKKAGIAEYCVDAGGDMAFCSTGEKLRVGLEDPDDSAKIIGVAEISNQSLCGSAGNRRSWADFHHIIDPVSLSSPRHIKAVWTIADTTLLADGLSTALFFCAGEYLRRHYNFEYLLIRADNSIERSSGFSAELYTS